MNPKDHAFINLSDEAFAELKGIAIAEYGDVHSDFEIREMGSRLLNFFDALIPFAGKAEKKDIPGKS
ncbi:MAG TPA: hypothetical protein VG347_17860 [Verrucomicrobiae bacterium]|nr:hypothetical protein [Verrucomicrobiae bacterium]